jgi:uncharacterized membrane protein
MAQEDNATVAILILTANSRRPPRLPHEQVFPMTSPADQSAPGKKRIHAIDIARGVALIAMASYHFTWDLELFGYVERGLTAVGGWRLYARCIAGSFLFLVGVSLVLAHGKGIRWPSFWRRWIMVAGAAALITLATWFAMPDAFIYFGILHEIALASLLGLAFLRVPPLVTLGAAAIFILARNVLDSDIFNSPAWWWLGLSTAYPRSNDFVPLFPWFGMVLIGIGAARLAQGAGLFEKLRLWRPPSWLNPLDFVGRHSLAFYLIHQPVLISLVWLAAQIIPPQLETPQVQFRQACERTCEASRDQEFCARYCVCMLEELETAEVLDRVLESDNDPQLGVQTRALAGLCSARSEPDAQPMEGVPQ